MMLATAVLLYSAEDPFELSKGALFRQTLIIFLVVVIYSLAIIVTGAEVNLEYSRQREAFMRHITFTQNGLTNIGLRVLHLKEMYDISANGKRRHRKGQGDYGPSLPPEDYVMNSEAEEKGNVGGLSEDEVSSQLDQLLAYEGRLQATLEALIVTKEAIELSTELHPVQFLRMDCTYGLAYTVLTTSFTLYVYIGAMVNGQRIDID